MALTVSMVYRFTYLSGPTWVASTVSMVYRFTYLSGPTCVASTVSMVFKVCLSFRAYMGGINCELLDELGNMYVYNISAFLLDFC